MSTGHQIGAWAELDHLGGQEAMARNMAQGTARMIADSMTRDEAEALAATAARAIARLDEVDERYGTEDGLIDGATLRFIRTIRGRVYGYAAIRGGGRWYLTGARSPQHLTWAELVRWLDGEGILAIERLSDGFGAEEDDR